MSIEETFKNWHRPVTLAEIIDHLRGNTPQDESEENVRVRHVRRYHTVQDDEFQTRPSSLARR